ncbi:nicotinamide riboside transporter PnuC [Alkalimonas collagenimarina]|uniref:Nicotinamide riboside transporter PnuC n=1 Tax=Alkalimonas collagenimarina TaxID=400390 RepID=A0ABT9GW76_9GAMM|nr:nicotinamide riboside transporter PnuC [Alkalimonas collagenimarina]MDP4535208.1 nicotinamide riboside transporter PnuC [Alkalimonas collagenimarina]
MIAAVQQFWQEWQMLTSLELLAMLLALAYLLLAMRHSLWCWPAALFSTVIYTYVMWQYALLSDALLQVYYAAMALYGWWHWRLLQQTKQQSKAGVKPVLEWGWQAHLTLITVATAAGLVLGYLMANYTHADYPWIDAMTTSFSVMTTYLVVRKLLSNWLYWLVIDLVCVYVYLQKGLYFTTALFVLYSLLAVIGYVAWRSHYRQQQLTKEPELQPV